MKKYEEFRKNFNSLYRIYHFRPRNEYEYEWDNSNSSVSPEWTPINFRDIHTAFYIPSRPSSFNCPHTQAGLIVRRQYITLFLLQVSLSNKFSFGRHEEGVSIQHCLKFHLSIFTWQQNDFFLQREIKEWKMDISRFLCWYSSMYVGHDEKTCPRESNNFW